MVVAVEVSEVEYLEYAIRFAGSYLNHRDPIDLEKALKLVTYTSPLLPVHLTIEIEQLMNEYNQLQSHDGRIEDFLYSLTHKLNYILLHLSYTNR